MNHRDFEAHLGPWLDGELAPAASAEMEVHLKQCPACTRAHASARALRQTISLHALAVASSDVLRGRVLEGVRAEAGLASRGSRRLGRGWTSLAAAAVLAVVATGSWQLATRRADSDRLVGDLVASHVRSLIGSHAMDVVSTDQHTVKPWFNGKLDYALPVYDFAGRGYPLVGGRLDYIGARRVAALVYERRSHVINVYLWPIALGNTGGPPAETVQGYHLMHWTAPAYSYWLVSDLGLGELTDFAHLLQQADSATR